MNKKISEKYSTFAYFAGINYAVVIANIVFRNNFYIHH